MKYTAASIKAALLRVGANKGFSYDGLDDLVCPATHILFDGQRRCNNMPPRDCREAINKRCKRKVNIYNDKAKTRLYGPLFFYFTISDTSREGFIAKSDNFLGRLIDRGDIKAEDLVEVP